MDIKSSMRVNVGMGEGTSNDIQCTHIRCCSSARNCPCAPSNVQPHPKIIPLLDTCHWTQTQTRGKATHHSVHICSPWHLWILAPVLLISILSHYASGTCAIIKYRYSQGPIFFTPSLPTPHAKTDPHTVTLLLNSQMLSALSSVAMHYQHTFPTHARCIC